MSTQREPVLWMVEGMSHSYVPRRYLADYDEYEAKSWIKQWTTPNNTKRFIDKDRDAAIKKWCDQTFSIPRTMNPTVVQCIAFIIRVVSFDEHGEELGWRAHTVYLTEK